MERDGLIRVEESGANPTHRIVSLLEAKEAAPQEAAPREVAPQETPRGEEDWEKPPSLDVRFADLWEAVVLECLKRGDGPVAALRTADMVTGEFKARLSR